MHLPSLPVKEGEKHFTFQLLALSYKSGIIPNSTDSTHNQESSQYSSYQIRNPINDGIIQDLQCAVGNVTFLIHMRMWQHLRRKRGGRGN